MSQLPKVMQILFVVCLITGAGTASRADSVVRDGKEWLQPANFKNLSWNEINVVCPLPSGQCVGFLGSVNVTGYKWATNSEIESLFISYGMPRIPDHFREISWFTSFFLDFEPNGDTSSARSLAGFAGNPGDLNSFTVPVYVLVDYKSVNTNDSMRWDRVGTEWPDKTHRHEIIGVWLWREEGAETPEEVFEVALEEPVDSEIHTGIGNLRGWAVATNGIEKVEIYVDGKYIYDAPYGGERTDVGERFPQIAKSDYSGFSLAYGYSNLPTGQHTITARAITELGHVKESSSTFNVVTFHKNFINKGDVVAATDSEITSSGDEINIKDIIVDGRVYDIKLKWRTAEQGFEIVEIR